MNENEVKKAHTLFNEGALEELNEFLCPFLNIGDPYAYYFSAKFSLDDTYESDEAYNKRYVTLLQKAAEGGVPEAMYRLSALHFTGDMVVLDNEIGRKYLNKALELNFGFAKLTVGINLFYGSNGYPKDHKRALELVTEAKNENVEDADEVLEKLQEMMQE